VFRSQARSKAKFRQPFSRIERGVCHLEFIKEKEMSKQKIINAFKIIHIIVNWFLILLTSHILNQSA